MVYATMLCTPVWLFSYGGSRISIKYFLRDFSLNIARLVTGSHVFYKSYLNPRALHPSHGCSYKERSWMKQHFFRKIWKIWRRHEPGGGGVGAQPLKNVAILDLPDPWKPHSLHLKRSTITLDLKRKSLTDAPKERWISFLWNEKHLCPPQNIDEICFYRCKKCLWDFKWTNEPERNKES